MSVTGSEPLNLMNDFSWESTKRLNPDAIMVAVAFSSLFAVPAIWLLVLNYTLIGLILLFVSVLVFSINFGRKKNVRVVLSGYELFYGDTLRAELRGLKGVKFQKQFGIHEVLVLQGAKGSNLIPMEGIPSHKRMELFEALAERIGHDQNL